MVSFRSDQPRRNEMNAMYMLCTKTNAPIHRIYSDASLQISSGMPMARRNHPSQKNSTADSTAPSTKLDASATVQTSLTFVISPAPR